MALESILDLPIYSFLRARCWYYDLQGLLAEPVAQRKTLVEGLDLEDIRFLHRSLLDLLEEDCANIRKGLYPVQVLLPESPLLHLKRMPWIVRDGLGMAWRRARGRTTVFGKKPSEYLNDVPRYYRRNFHFQTDGYLSEESAELYDHQVEILFSGTADLMRRLIIPPLKHHFKDHPTGKGLRFLEYAAGTGRATNFIRRAFPEAKITVTDLSYPYLKKAQKNLTSFSRLDFIQADAEKLPFQDEHFDAVFSVFLYHELPLKAREGIIQDTKRVLKSKGFWGFVDSIQKKAHPTFDKLLPNFPKTFHEPFYRDYTQHPMEELLKKSGFSNPQSKNGYLSKVVYAVKD